MNKPKCVAIMGPDRVGKSTLIKNLYESLTESGKKVVILHFSGPQPRHNSPIDQYIIPLDGVLKDSPEYIICDRFGAEVCFYEYTRRHVDISEEWARSCESHFLSKTDLSVFMVKKPWCWSLPHHRVEILEQYPGCTEWFMNMKLEERKYEHEEYYRYINNFIYGDDGSLIDSKNWNIITSYDPFELLNKVLV